LRSNYQAIHSSITRSHLPIDIVKAFMDIYPFKTLYIADLNSIQNIGVNNQQTIHTVLNTFPEMEIWLDAGISKSQPISFKHKNIKPVLGTESFEQLLDYNEAAKQLPSAVLSLDFLPEGYRGPRALLEDASLWPDKVIAMTLNQVGPNTGADIHTINKILACAQHRHIYAAGGIRNINDLHKLQSIGVKGALIASSLHNKQINGDQLLSIAA